MEKSKNISKSLKSVLIGYEFFRVMHPGVVGCFEKVISGTIIAVKAWLFYLLVHELREDFLSFDPELEYQLIQRWHIALPVGFMLYALCLDCLKNRLSFSSKVSLGLYALGCIGLRAVDAHFTGYAITLALSALLLIPDVIEGVICTVEKLHSIDRFFRR